LKDVACALWLAQPHRLAGVDFRLSCAFTRKVVSDV